MAFYDTDSYDSRIYIMESDLRGVSTHPPLYDEGRRWFVLLHWKPFRWFELSAKYTRMQSDRLRNPPDTEVIAMEDLDSRFGIQIDAGW
jgi:hypothetical protein